MTRINLVPVEELSDQHLIAEYKELPRVVKQKINIEGAPKKYTLGSGHVKWARLHLIFTLDRYYSVCTEMKQRGFSLNYQPDELYICATKQAYISEYRWLHYVPTNEDVELSRNRIIEKIKMKPNWYKWTLREKPAYVKEMLNERKNC